MGSPVRNEEETMEMVSPAAGLGPDPAWAGPGPGLGLAPMHPGSGPGPTRPLHAWPGLGPGPSPARALVPAVLS